MDRTEQRFNALKAIRTDMTKAEISMDEEAIRWLVDTYYQIQGMRVRVGNQIFASTKEEKKAEPCEWMALFHALLQTMEEICKSALNRYAKSRALGRWAMEVCGIGPVIAAGLLAHIDITKASAPTKIWRYAGLDPTSKWEKGEKRPWNAALRRLCWLIGESFVKVSGNEKSLYGRLYKQRKEYEIAKNESGEYADQVAERLERRKTSAEAKTWKEGKLTPGHIHSRSKRFAVKLFLAHYHAAAMYLELGQQAPEPFAIAHLGHVDVIDPELPFEAFKE